jgi:rhamnosyltransferase
MREAKFSNICCLVISYNPEDRLFNLIDTLEHQTDQIIMVDNNSNPQAINRILTFIEGKEAILIRNKENLGIAKALNQGILLAREMGYEWIVTFDQDSIPYPNIIDVLRDVYFLYPDKERIGAIGVNFPTSTTQSYYPVSKHKKYSVRDYLITSGCLMSIEAYTLVGGFRDDFFIDNVDLEYSLRLKKYGKVSLITNAWGMKHNAGHPDVKRFLGMEVISTNHNSFRRYYMSRNHVVLSKEYFLRFPYFIAKLNYFYFLSLFKILLVEDDKIGKMRASIKGIIDGFFYNKANKSIK